MGIHDSTRGLAARGSVVAITSTTTTAPITAPSSATTTVAATTAPASTSARATARGSRASFIDRQTAAVVVLTVEPLDRGQGLVVVRHLDKAKTSTAPRLAIAQDLGRGHHAELLKEFLKLGRGRRVLQIPNIKTFCHRSCQKALHKARNRLAIVARRADDGARDAATIYRYTRPSLTKPVSPGMPTS